MSHIRDPIHGSIELSRAELAVVDDPVFQRLRGIKQLGFTEHAFPGATHNRFCHGLGAMELAGQMFDRLFPLAEGRLPGPARSRLRQAVRLALLLHDIGHPPASHASEVALPLRSSLGLGAELLGPLDRQASHEDFTLKLLLHGSVGETVDRGFAGLGVERETVAHLMTGRFPGQAERFVVDGVDYAPVLRQLVSGDLDADRMDYLQRDAFFAGVTYGKFDQLWLLENLRVHVVDHQAFLALTDRALIAFEDFLLSRYHMFVSVYLHRIPVGYESMLARFYAEDPEALPMPAAPEGYLAVDDLALWSALRRSSSRWARRIVGRQGFSVALEWTTPTASPDLEGAGAALRAAGIEYFVSRTASMLRKPQGGPPIYMVSRDWGTVRRIDEVSLIFERYAQPAPLTRIYVPSEHKHPARAVLQAWGRQGG